MKKLLLLTTSLFSLGTFAQAPDFTFEGTWSNSTFGSVADPTGWVTSNLLTSFLISSSNPITTTQGTAAGNFCQGLAGMRLETKKMQTVGLLAGTIPDTCGFAFSGSIAGTVLKDGVAFTQRPLQLTYCYNTTLVGGDTSGVGIRLWKWQGGTRVFVATGTNTYIANSPAGMTNQVINLNYLNNLIPDSALFLVGSSYKFPINGLNLRKKAKVGSTITVDNFATAGTFVGIKERTVGELALNVFPNPANTFVRFATENADATSLEIYDITGKIVSTHTFENGKIQVALSTYQSGLYVYKVYDNSKQLLKAGKLTVTH